MGYPDGLQLDISIEPDAFKDVGGQVLVRVITEPAFKVAEVEVGVRRDVEVAEDAALMPTVPHSVTSPLCRLGLTDGNGLAAAAVDVGRGDPRRQLWSRIDVRSSSAFWNHSSALALASSDGIMSRMVGQAGA
jgi:hypothetical protein